MAGAAIEINRRTLFGGVTVDYVVSMEEEDM